MKVLYIAGPYRGTDAWEIAQNIRRAEEVALCVWSMGAVALCPHANTAHFQGALPDAVWLDGDLELLRRCDGVVVVRGWQQSAGATAEVELARELGKPAFTLEDPALRAWVKG